MKSKHSWFWSRCKSESTKVLSEKELVRVNIWQQRYEWSQIYMDLGKLRSNKDMQQQFKSNWIGNVRNGLILCTDLIKEDISEALMWKYIQ